MRRLILIILALAFGGLLVAVSVNAEAEKSIASAAEEVVVGENGFDYYLPYPGILPDHPFYWLKVARDWVKLWITRIPVERAELLLLYADKRVGAAEALVKGNKPELAVTIAAKAQQYLARAFDEVDRLGEEGMKQVLQERVAKSRLKHLEVLMGFSEYELGDSEGTILQIIEAVKAKNNGIMVEVIDDDAVEVDSEVMEASDSGNVQPMELRGSL